MKRKLLSIVLALCLTLTLLPTATFAAGSYADTNGHWAEAAIERWSGYGILQGADGKFSPDGTLTRAQMATILSRLLALPEASSYGFTDVAAGDWFADAIDRCAAAGIMQGTGGKAEPNAPITREQAMVMLCRALGIDAVAANLSGYPDGAQVSAYAAGYVAALVQMGIVKGDANGKLNPAGNITRAEIVTIIDRLITVYANVDGAVINAANGGTVLVTAKNVSIANAPEGTKVIAAKGADGLSVNGKPVAAGQTYIVPSSEDGTSYTPGTGTYVPHKHTYTYTDNGDGTHTGVCACGNSTVEEHTIKDGRCVLCRAVLTTDTVASVKNSDGTYTYFETLADAIAAAKDGDTVTVVSGSSENFVVPSGKDITLDLNGCEITTSKQPKIEEGGSLTIRGEGGSIILEEYGIYLEGSLTLESGKIESKKNSDVIFIMGNGNFTMTGGMLLADAGACIDASYLTNGVSRLNITGGVVETKDPSVNAIYINNRWGSGKIELTISGGTIKAAKQAAIALDDSVSTISLTGGTYSSDPSAYVADGYFSVPSENGTYMVVTANQITSGVIIGGIAGYEHRAFATVEEAFETIKADLAARCGLVEQSMSNDDFDAFFIDGGKITWTIYGSQKVTDARTFSFGRGANRFSGSRHITEINIVGGNAAASLDLSEVNGTFTLPYNWWDVEESVNTALKCKGITFDAITSMPSGTYQCKLHPTTYEFDGCTFNGNVYSYQNFDVVMTIKNSTFNAPNTTTQYAFMSQGAGGTITLDNNKFYGYTRGVNFQRPTVDFTFTNNTITSTVSEPDRGAIQLTDGKSFVVTGNIVNVNAGNAFWFHDAATNADVTYIISNNNINAKYLGYSAVKTFDVNTKITSSGNIFNSTDTTMCMKKGCTVAEVSNLTAIQ